jgi:uroporphyrin-III C-methyltransferase
MPHDPQPGAVALVGAGPGPADLMTVRALRAVEGAGALLYDALVHDEVLALAPRGCIRIQTGKRAGRPSMKQETINRLMLRLARRGLRVVRLKGGDPSVFGRSGEEQTFLERHGVAVSIVPGVTAASAAAAQFGFPLTHRGAARRLVLATARIHDGSVVEDGWAAQADPGATLALYMARDCCDAVAQRLIEAGRSPRTPAIAVENAGAAHARLIHADLESLPAMLAAAACAGPVLLVIGEVVAGAGKMAGAHDAVLRRAGGQPMAVTPPPSSPRPADWVRSG